MAGSLPRGLTGLTHLTVCKGFKQPVVAGVLPAGLTQLTFGYDFNQPVGVGVLPAGLAQLNVTCPAFARIAGIPFSCSVHFLR